jgi:hypothetical protein
MVDKQRLPIWEAAAFCLDPFTINRYHQSSAQGIK